MSIKHVWAAFLASVAVVCSGSVASAAAPRPTFACFTPSNANLIGHLGPNDSSVRAAFEAGACLALPAGIAVSDVQHNGSLWRFKALGGAPELFAADWAAGFAGSSDEQMSAAFNAFLPVTGRLLETGHSFVDCYDATVKLSAWSQDLNRRWKDYENRGGLRYAKGASMRMVIYVGDEGPKLAAEWEAIQREGQVLDGRCRPYQSVEADRSFIAFVRSTRGSV